MKKILCATWLVLFFAMQAYAAEHRSTNGQAHGIGIGGTVFNTWGFNYRRYLDAHWGVTANLGGWIASSYGQLGTAVGASYTFAHHSFEHSSLPHSSIRIYGVGYVSGIYKHSWQGSGSGGSTEFDVGFGAGPGAEFFFNPHFAVNLELPWMTFFRLSKMNSGFESSHPHVGGGVTYYF